MYSNTKSYIQFNMEPSDWKSNKTKTDRQSYSSSRKKCDFKNQWIRSFWKQLSNDIISMFTKSCTVLFNGINMIGILNINQIGPSDPGDEIQKCVKLVTEVMEWIEVYIKHSKQTPRNKIIITKFFFFVCFS